MDLLVLDLDDVEVVFVFLGLLSEARGEVVLLGLEELSGVVSVDFGGVEELVELGF